METSHINKTKIKCDIQTAYEESQQILKICGLNIEKLQKLPSYQVSLVHRKGVQGLSRLKDGIKALWDENTQQRIAFEYEYTEFNDSLKDTYLYQIYLKLQEKTNGQVGRYRLMWLNPLNCYYFHTDKNEPNRFHLVLKTNPHCFFLYKNDLNIFKTYHIPQNQHIYSVYAGEPHTFLNAGKTTRLHLLVTLKTSKKNYHID